MTARNLASAAPEERNACRRYPTATVVPEAVRASLRGSVGAKRILVTGGAGFLGSHLCKSPLDEGHEVLCVGNFFVGSAIVREPLPADEPKQRQPDITVAREKLGWELAVPLKAGLARTIDYFERLLAEG